jgi:hypothetical protein
MKVNLRGTRLVYELVLEAFVGAAPDGYQVEHLDGDRSNNRLSNLCWRRKQTKSKGSLHPRAKLNEIDVEAVYMMAQAGMPLSQIADWFSLSKSQVSKIKNRKAR